jgi:hypothetical protein
MKKLRLDGDEDKWTQILKGKSSWGQMGRERIILEYCIGVDLTEIKLKDLSWFKVSFIVLFWSHKPADWHRRNIKETGFHGRS